MEEMRGRSSPTAEFAKRRLGTRPRVHGHLQLRDHRALRWQEALDRWPGATVRHISRCSPTGSRGNARAPSVNPRARSRRIGPRCCSFACTTRVVARWRLRFSTSTRRGACTFDRPEARPPRDQPCGCGGDGRGRSRPLEGVPETSHRRVRTRIRRGRSRWVAATRARSIPGSATWTGSSTTRRQDA